MGRDGIPTLSIIHSFEPDVLIDHDQSRYISALLSSFAAESSATTAHLLPSVKCMLHFVGPLVSQLGTFLSGHISSVIDVEGDALESIGKL